MIDINIFENKKAAYFTLGCKLNFAETSSIGKALQEQGVRRVEPGEKADVCIINTCSVTELADKKCRNMIRRARREHPGALIVVTGCYAQLSPEEIAAIEGVDLIIGTEQKQDLINLLRQHAERISSQNNSQGLGISHIIHTPTKDIRTFSPSVSADDRTRHFLKVQDGCDYYCTYCTIPKARGRSRNGSIASLVQQARSVAENGGREIVLTGVNIGDFGRTTGETFLDLIKALDRVEGIERYRISSIEPNLLSDEVIDFCASSRHFMPHFHIPLQSGSDEVLKLMKRRYDTALFRNRIEHIKQVMPDSFIGVDVIVGTRGERPEYFEACYRFLESIPFTQLHVFSYSERPGTKALEIPYAVGSQDKHKRSQALLKLSDKKLRAFYREHIGQPLRVLWEQAEHDGMMLGFSDQYIRVVKPYSEESVGQLEEVVPKRFDPAMLSLIF